MGNTISDNLPKPNNLHEQENYYRYLMKANKQNQISEDSLQMPEDSLQMPEIQGPTRPVRPLNPTRPLQAPSRPIQESARPLNTNRPLQGPSRSIQGPTRPLKQTQPIRPLQAPTRPIQEPSRSIQPLQEAIQIKGTTDIKIPFKISTISIPAKIPIFRIPSRIPETQKTNNLIKQNNIENSDTINNYDYIEEEIISDADMTPISKTETMTDEPNIINKIISRTNHIFNNAW